MTHAVCCWCKAPLVQAEGVWWCGNRDDSCRKRQAAWAAGIWDKKLKKQAGWRYVPTPKQVEAHEAQAKVKHALNGGAAGPGKSRQLREALYRECLLTPGLTCLLLRRTYKQLEDTHLREFTKDAPRIGAEYLESKKLLRFPNGALIQAGHCETEADAQNYLSTEYDRIVFDELVTFDEGPALEIMTRARTSKPEVLARGGAKVWAASNPGGRGALWVKDFFIDQAPDPEQYPRYRAEDWSFVEARLDDNPYIDPDYRLTLENLPEMRRRQLLEGDWTAYEGQFFGEFRAVRAGVPWHVQDIALAGGLEYFASMDWGYNAPGVVLWWACLADGRYHVARELKFQGDSAEVVGQKIHAINGELGVRTSLRYIACDPAMWQKTGAGKGEAIAETLRRMQLPVRKSDNDRFNGWLRVHELLRAKDTEAPWLTIDPGCRYLIRTLPAMVQDTKDPDDLDSSKDDHACDALRYGAMSRPRPTVFRQPEAKLVEGSLGWWRKQHQANASGVLA
jgi:hypothetical protein